MCFSGYAGTRTVEHVTNVPARPDAPLPRACLPKVAVLLLLGLLFALPVAAQQTTADTTARPLVRERNLPDDHSPGGALWRAAALPGWGQVYNRQYYKLPVVYLGLAGITATALYANRRYLLYRHAYLYAEPRLWEDDTPAFPEYEDAYLRLLDENGIPRSQADTYRARLAPVFRQNRENMRRNRDLLYVGIGLFYGLTIVDAYVSAHLLDFDVSDDLTVRFHPLPGGLGATVRMSY